MADRVDINDPRPGFYRKKLAKGGVWVPVRIWITEAERDEAGDLLEDEIIRCEVDGEERDPFEVWPWVDEKSIDESEYRYMRAGAEWDRKNDPDAPAANPRQAIDISKTRSLF